MRLGDSQDALAHATAVPAAGDPGHTGHRVRSLDLQSGKISTLRGSFCVFLKKTITFLRCGVYIYICIYVYIYMYVYFVLICGSAVVSIVLCQFLLVYCSMSNTRGGLEFPEMKAEVVSHIADVHTRGVGMVGSRRVDDPISLFNVHYKVWARVPMRQECTNSMSRRKIGWIMKRSDPQGDSVFGLNGIRSFQPCDPFLLQSHSRSPTSQCSTR